MFSRPVASETRGLMSRVCGPIGHAKRDETGFMGFRWGLGAGFLVDQSVFEVALHELSLLTSSVVNPYGFLLFSPPSARRRALFHTALRPIA